MAKFIQKTLLLSSLLTPFVVAISCQSQPPKLVVTFPDTLANGSNIDFDSLETKNIKNLSFKINETGKSIIQEFINTDNKNLEKALKIAKDNIIFAATLIITHTGHNHDVVLNNILLSSNYGNFFLQLQTFEDGTIFKITDQQISFNYKIATSNKLFSYVHNTK